MGRIPCLTSRVSDGEVQSPEPHSLTCGGYEVRKRHPLSTAKCVLPHIVVDSAVRGPAMAYGPSEPSEGTADWEDCRSWWPVGIDELPPSPVGRGRVSLTDGDLIQQATGIAACEPTVLVSLLGPHPSVQFACLAAAAELPLPPIRRHIGSQQVCTPVALAARVTTHHPPCAGTSPQHGARLSDSA